MNKLNSIAPLYISTLGFVLVMVGLFVGNGEKVHDIALAMVSGGLGAYMNNGQNYRGDDDES